VADNDCGVPKSGLSKIDVNLRREEDIKLVAGEKSELARREAVIPVEEIFPGRNFRVPEN
jgi:hypothetical protein